MCEVVHAASPIPTRIVFLGTERDLGLTIFTCNEHTAITRNEHKRFSGQDITCNNTGRALWRLNPSNLSLCPESKDTKVLTMYNFFNLQK
jgi:hypothetical protein